MFLLVFFYIKTVKRGRAVLWMRKSWLLSREVCTCTYEVGNDEARTCLNGSLPSLSVDCWDIRVTGRDMYTNGKIIDRLSLLLEYHISMIDG